jgi:response regulator NasT
MQHALRIIVADDDPNLSRFVQEVLPHLGPQVFEVHTGGQLVEMCRLLRPDLVLTAVRFPDLDGIAAAEEICREQPTPILVVSGDQDAGAIERALPNPCILACLFKPIKEADLRAALALAVRRFEQIESLRKEAADLRQALEDRKLIERAKGLVMRYTGLDEPEAFRRLRRLASDRNRKLAEVAQDILVAGEVFQALDQAAEGEKSSNGRARHTGRGLRPAPARTSLDGRRVLPSPTPVPQDGQATGAAGRTSNRVALPAFDGPGKKGPDIPPRSR